MNMNDVLYDYPPDDDGLPFDENAGYSQCPVCHHISLFNDECQNCTFGGEDVSPQSEGGVEGNPTTHAADGAEVCPVCGTWWRGKDGCDECGHIRPAAKA